MRTEKLFWIFFCFVLSLVIGNLCRNTAKLKSFVSHHNGDLIMWKCVPELYDSESSNFPIVASSPRDQAHLCSTLEEREVFLLDSCPTSSLPPRKGCMANLQNVLASLINKPILHILDVSNAKKFSI